MNLWHPVALSKHLAALVRCLCRLTIDRDYRHATWNLQTEHIHAGSILLSLVYTLRTTRDLNVERMTTLYKDCKSCQMGKAFHFAEPYGVRQSVSAPAPPRSFSSTLNTL